MSDDGLIRLEDAEHRARGGDPTPIIDELDPVRLHGKPIPPRRWLVPGLIPWKSVTLLGGDGGLGKSLLAMQLQAAAAIGQDWIGFETQPVKSYGIYCEDDADELHRRLADIARHHGVELGDLADMLMAPRVGHNSVLASTGYDRIFRELPLFQAVKAKCREHGAQLLIIDTVADTFGGNENFRGEVRTFINLLRQIAIEIDGAVVLTAHPSKDGLSTGSGISGSTAWNNSVRSRVYLTRPNTDDGEEDRSDERVLKTMKANYGGLHDDIRLVWRDGVFVRIEEPSGTIGAIERRSAEGAFLEGLDALQRQGRAVSESRNAGNFAPKVIAGMKVGKRHGRGKLAKAMERLFDEGKIKVETYGRTGDRHKRIVIVGEEGHEK